MAAITLGAACGRHAPGEPFDPGAIKISTDRVVKTDTVGDGEWERQATFVLVDADNVSAGELLVTLGGALTEPADRAVLFFRGDGPEVAESFATVDPYVTEGLVKSWSVRRWMTVVGPDAATPVRPEGASERLLVGEIRVFCYGVPSAPHTVTIRDRDSLEQTRLPLEQCVAEIRTRIRNA